MAEMSYKMGDLRRLIKESANEFKPKMGNGVESGNKTNNDKSYKDSKKRAKDFDGGGDEYKPSTKAYEKIDDNKTTLDVEIENASDEFKNKVEAQVGGKTSTLSDKNGIEQDPSLEFDKKTYPALMKSHENAEKAKQIGKESGLTSRVIAKENPNAFKKGSVFHGNQKKDKNIKENKIAVLNFKKTTFLNEEHMISRIPDEYKVEGNKFKMKDNGGNEFMVEWKDNEANVLSHINKKKLNESMNRIQHLFNYSYSDNKEGTTSKTRIEEDKSLNEMISKVRNLTE